MHTMSFYFIIDFIENLTTITSAVAVPTCHRTTFHWDIIPHASTCQVCKIITTVRRPSSFFSDTKAIYRPRLSVIIVIWIWDHSPLYSKPSCTRLIHTVCKVPYPKECMRANLKQNSFYKRLWRKWQPNMLQKKQKFKGYEHRRYSRSILSRSMLGEMILLSKSLVAWKGMSSLSRSGNSSASQPSNKAQPLGGGE